MSSGAAEPPPQQERRVQKQGCRCIEPDALIRYGHARQQVGQERQEDRAECQQEQQTHPELLDVVQWAIGFAERDKQAAETRQCDADLGNGC